MAVGKEVRGPLWVDGQFTVRVRGPGPEPGRVIRVRRPFALIGQIPGADIRIDDPAIDGRHAFLLLDRRGIFGVDLLTRTGTRFAGSASVSAWLGAGDILEIAGRRVELLQLRVGGTPIDPPLANVDFLADADASELVDLTLEPLDSPGPPWMLGSTLAFVGRGEACAIRIENASASRTHCALLRGPSTAYVIDLLGRRTLVNERPIEGASALLDGDVLSIGQARFGVRIQRPSELSSRPIHDPRPETIEPGSPVVLSRLADAYQGSQELALGPRETMLALLLGAAESGRDSSRHEVLDVLRQFQADTATLLEAQIERIETLNREIASLRNEIRGPRGPLEPLAPPLRLDLKSPQPATTDESATWLLDRLNTLETESRSTWKDLLGRIASSVIPRSAPSPSGQSLASTRPEPSTDDPS
jgi:pSer/pThr/pTyr-binding forkhead associated (FHA) protein